MSNVIPFQRKNEATATQKTPAADINRVLAEMHKETGIDFLKVVTGDEKENKRFRFKQYQDAVKF
ncbi:hypothetical protein ABEX29_01000 [Brevibacillus porteri]|uniref:hypothetical protein n=1 Tax=Brevibacillus porteri TaxID=2126350 RepID=UPI003D1DB97F